MVRPFILADRLSPLPRRRRALLAGWAVRLRRNRRRPVRDGEPPCADRPLRRQYPVGVLQRRGVPLASIALALAHARLPALRTGTWWPSYYERSPARSQHGPAVCRAREADEGLVAERDRGGSLRVAPVARRIRCLGGGAQGCPERTLLSSHAVGLCGACDETQPSTTRPRGPALRSRPHGEADARDVTPPSPPARLLAVAPVQRCPAADAPRREAPLAGYGRAGELGRSARRPRDPFVRGRSLASVPSRERRRRVCELSRKDLLAEQARGVLSPAPRYARGRHPRRRPPSRRAPHGRHRCPPPVPLRADRLALVRHRAPPGARSHPSEQPGDGRSLHLPSVDRALRRAGLGFGRSLAKMAGAGILEGWRHDRDTGAPCHDRPCPAGVLDGYLDALRACIACHRAELACAQHPRARAGATGQPRRRDLPSSGLASDKAELPRRPEQPRGRSLASGQDRRSGLLLRGGVARATGRGVVRLQSPP